MSINERIKQVRQVLSLSQPKFAARIAISTSYLSDMEHSKNPVSERVIRLIGMEFGVNENWIRTGNGEMYNEQEEIDVVNATSLFKSLSSKFREHALVMLNSLSELDKFKDTSTQ